MEIGDWDIDTISVLLVCRRIEKAPFSPSDSCIFILVHNLKASTSDHCLSSSFHCIASQPSITTLSSFALLSVAELVTIAYTPLSCESSVYPLPCLRDGNRMSPASQWHPAPPGAAFCLNIVLPYSKSDWLTPVAASSRHTLAIHTTRSAKWC